VEPAEIRALAAENIRRLAVERGISLNHLADFAGIGRPAFYRCLGGDEAMTLDRLGKIATALEVHPMELLRPVTPEKS
jgi:DNA-binding Xre family transcriptional regulator